MMDSSKRNSLKDDASCLSEELVLSGEGSRTAGGLIKYADVCLLIAVCLCMHVSSSEVNFYTYTCKPYTVEQQQEYLAR